MAYVFRATIYLPRLSRYSEKHLKDKRNNNGGRRDYDKSPEPSFEESDGSSETSDPSQAPDRRRVPDRRTDNIEVDWIDEAQKISK